MTTDDSTTPPERPSFWFRDAVRLEKRTKTQRDGSAENEYKCPRCGYWTVALTKPDRRQLTLASHGTLGQRCPGAAFDPETLAPEPVMTQEEAEWDYRQQEVIRLRKEHRRLVEEHRSWSIPHTPSDDPLCKGCPAIRDAARAVRKAEEISTALAQLTQDPPYGTTEPDEAGSSVRAEPAAAATPPDRLDDLKESIHRLRREHREEMAKWWFLAHAPGECWTCGKCAAIRKAEETFAALAQLRNGGFL